MIRLDVSYLLNSKKLKMGAVVVVVLRGEGDTRFSLIPF